MKTTRAQKTATKCHAPRIGDLFIPYLNGDISSRHRLRIDAHLNKCQECRSELGLMSDLKKAWLRIRQRV